MVQNDRDPGSDPGSAPCSLCDLSKSLLSEPQFPKLLLEAQRGEEVT